MLPLALLVSTFALTPADGLGLRLEPPRLRVPAMAAAPSLPRLLDGALKSRMPQWQGQSEAPARVADGNKSSAGLALDAYLLGVGVYAGSEVAAALLFVPALFVLERVPAGEVFLLMLGMVEVIWLFLTPAVVGAVQAGRLNRDPHHRVSPLPGIAVGMAIEVALLFAFQNREQETAELGFSYVLFPGAVAVMSGGANALADALAAVRWFVMPALQLAGAEIALEPFTSPGSPHRAEVPSWPSPLANARDARHPLVFEAFRLSF